MAKRESLLGQISPKSLRLCGVKVSFWLHDANSIDCSFSSSLYHSSDSTSSRKSLAKLFRQIRNAMPMSGFPLVSCLRLMYVKVAPPPRAPPTTSPVVILVYKVYCFPHQTIALRIHALSLYAPHEILSPSNPLFSSLIPSHCHRRHRFLFYYYPPKTCIAIPRNIPIPASSLDVHRIT